MILTLAISTAGCETIAKTAGRAVLGASGKGVTADAEVTVGQKKEDNDVETEVRIGEETQKAQTINNNNTGPDGYIILLLVLLAGWAIPDPLTTMRGIRKGWRALRGKREAG